MSFLSEILLARLEMEKDQTVVHVEGFYPSERRWLFYRSWRTSASHGDIIAVHGAAEHSGRYEEIGKAMALAGYNFYVCDLTGHGRSEGKRGHIQQFEDYLVDLSNFYAFLRRHKKLRNPFILGHSMGGLLATLFVALGQCYVKGMILSGPLFRLKIKIPIWKKAFLPLANVIYPTLVMENKIDPHLLCHDPAVVENYITDPYVSHKVSIRWFSEISKAMKRAQLSAPYIDTPALLLHGEEDAICDKDAAIAFFHHLPPQNKEFYMVKQAYHEIFNEVAWPKLVETTLNWIQQVEQATRSPKG